MLNFKLLLKNYTTVIIGRKMVVGENREEEKGGQRRFPIPIKMYHGK